MKELRQVEIAVCDLCKGDECVYNRCTKCGIDVCNDCIDSDKAKEFTAIGPVDRGIYCERCISICVKENDELYRAYLILETYQEAFRSYQAQYTDFRNKAMKDLEAAYKRITV